MLAAPVVNLHVVAVDKRTATVTWDSQTPPDIGSKVLEYQVIYKSSNRDIHQVFTLVPFSLSVTGHLLIYNKGTRRAFIFAKAQHQQYCYE